jgi:hypothetical protein
LCRRKPEISRQFDPWLKPELCLAIGANDMHMHSGLFSRKEEESIASMLKDSGAHPERYSLDDA